MRRTVAPGVILHILSLFYVASAFVSYSLISWLKEFEPREGKIRKEEEAQERSVRSEHTERDESRNID